MYLPPRLMAMLIQFHFEGAPPVEIEHRPELTPLIVQQVLDGTLHVGFGFLPQEHPDLTVRQLCEEPLVACLPASHPISAKYTIYLCHYGSSPVQKHPSQIFIARLLMPSSIVFPPVECCLGTSPSQAERFRPKLVSTSMARLSRVNASITLSTMTDCRASLSRLKSATSLRRRPFSSRSRLASCASLVSMPSYFDFQA
jgi:DNA-binding transcriptional LysR family regulator